MERSQGPVEFLIEVARDSGPLHEQIERTVRNAIRAGRLRPGVRLPSSRALATDLGISRGVVSAAYEQLVAEGFLESRQGAPVRVAPGVREQSSAPFPPSLQEHFRYDFRPGQPDLVGFPRDRFMRSLRRAWYRMSPEMIGYADPRGTRECREALAEYLNRIRGAAAEAEHMIVCTGSRQGLALTCRWLRGQGVTRIAVEDPGWHPATLIVEEAGLAVSAVPVDAQGIDVSELRASGAEAVIVTPAHQFPTGSVLSPERRAALIAWAEDGDRLIIEDDYDGELMRDRVGALQGLAPDRVLYVGSASKRMAPGLRLGWMVLPSWLSWPLVSAKAIEDAGSGAIGQLALADFISHGELDRHTRRMRLRYQRRAEALVKALQRDLPSWTITGPPGGLHLVASLPEDLSEPGLLAAAAREHVGIEGLAVHAYGASCQPAIVLGYGYLSEAAIERGVSTLACVAHAELGQTAHARG